VPALDETLRILTFHVTDMQKKQISLKRARQELQR
jgi:hypothetical protein